MDGESHNTRWIRPIAASAIIGLIIIIYLFWDDSQTNWRLSSGPIPGKYYETGSALSSLINGNLNLSSRIKLVHLPSEGSKENAERLKERKTDLALIQNDTIAPLDSRTLMVLYQELLFFMVNKDSGISNFLDLDGKKIGLGPAGGGTESVFHEICLHFHISENNFNLINNSFSELSKLLIKGKIDALFVLSGLDNHETTKLVSNENVDLLGFESNGAPMIDGLIATHPYYEKSVIPSYAFPSPNSDNMGLPVSPKITIGINALLVGPDKLDPTLVKECIELIYHNRPNIIRNSPHLHNMHIPSIRDKIQFPPHKGAIDYASRNNPSFLEKYAEAMGFVLSVAILVLGALKGLSQRLKEKQKDIFDDFYLKIDSIIDKSHDTDVDFNTLENLTNELDSIRHAALKLLVSEKLPADQNYLILLSMIHDCNALIEKQLETKPKP